MHRRSMTSSLSRLGHRRVRWWVAMLLPGFLLRSLIPVGFMPMVGAGHGLQLIVCDGYAPVPWSSAPMPMDMPDMPMGAAAHPGGSHHTHHPDHGACPYGSSPALGALPTLAMLPAVVQRPAEPAAASPQVAHFEVSARAQSARGPPA